MRLTNLAPALDRLSPRIAEAPPPSVDWKRWYTTRKWRKLRWSVLVRDNFRCQACGHIEADTSRLIADHIEPHRGDRDLFWHGELRTLCKQCHDALTAATPHNATLHRTPQRTATRFT